MHPILRRTPARVSLAFALVLAACDRDAPSGPTLSLRAAPGAPVRFVHTMKARQSTKTMGGTIENSADVTTELSLEVRDRAADGSWKAVARFGRIHGRVSMPLLGTRDLDSQAPLPSENNGKSVVLSFCALSGNEFPLVLEPSGRVRSVAGVAEAVSATASRHGGDASLHALVAEALSEKKVRETVDFALVVTPLPDGGIAKGTSWEDADSVPGLSSGVEMTAKYRQEVAEIAPETVRVVGKGALEYRALPGKGTTARMGALISNAEKKAATVACDGSVSRADGLPLAATSEIRLSLGLRDEKGQKPLGDMEQEVTYRLDRVAAWPSEAKAAEPPPK